MYTNKGYAPEIRVKVVLRNGKEVNLPIEKVDFELTGACSDVITYELDVRP